MYNSDDSLGRRMFKSCKKLDGCILSKENIAQVNEIHEMNIYCIEI